MGKIKCLKCGDIVESNSVHEMNWCKCGAVAVDGGNDYMKITGELCNFEILEGINLSKCCFCGKEINPIHGHDPRPIKIVDEEYPVCCGECNARIVVPTRKEIWHIDSENVVLKDQLAGFKALMEEMEVKTARGLKLAFKKNVEDLVEKVKDNQLLELALTKAREYMFNVMCADDVPSIDWFIQLAKEDLGGKNE